MTRILALVAVAVCVPVVEGADIILSAAGVNATLKKMERLRQQIDTGGAAAKGEALFELGMEADAFAQLINDEVAAHGSQEKALIDLAVARTRELGVAIAYNREKKKFFYDNAAFREYVSAFPRGAHAAEAAFKTIEGEYFQSNPDDVAAVKASAGRKVEFLRKYPAFKENSEVSLMLSIDYRDLYRHYAAAKNARERDRYLALTRTQLSRTATRYKGTEPAQIAAEILKRFNDEVRRGQG